MKSRTSFCKAAAFRKDITRFVPVWVGYILFLILMQTAMDPAGRDFWYASNIGDSISAMGMVNLVYGFVVAQTMFGDLFNARLCNGLHTLPLRREQWFGVHIWVGLLYSLIPTALMMGACEIALAVWGTNMVDGWQIPLYWWGAANLQYLFFFALAVLCVLCAGNRLGALVNYGILNFFSLLLFLMVDHVYVPLLFGVVVLSDVFEMLCPAVQIVDTRFIDSERIATGKTYIDISGVEQREYIGKFTLQQESWVYIGVLAVLGILLLLIARQVYKSRKLERAGDFLAVGWLEPVFQVVCTVLSAVLLYGAYYMFFGYNSDNTYALLAVGLVVGWFGGRMLLERTTRVFRLKNILGMVAMMAVMAASLFVTRLDPLNISGWIPTREELSSVTLSTGYNKNYTTEDLEEIQRLLRVHELALEERAEVHSDYTADYYNPDAKDAGMAFVSLHYNREDSFPSYREYYVPAQSEAGQIVREFMGRLEVVLAESNVKNADELRRQILLTEGMYLSGREIPAEQLTEEFLSALAEAIIADCEERTLVQTAAFHPEPIMEGSEEKGRLSCLHLDLSGQGIFYGNLQVYADSKNTMKVLESAGLLEQILAEYR